MKAGCTHLTAALCNQFNTVALPLSDKRSVKARLVLHLLLADRVLVPATSFLCSPATSWLLQSERGFLLELGNRGWLVPVLGDDLENFRHLVDELARAGAKALGLEGLSTVREKATFLDEHEPAFRPARVKPESLQAEKTKLSLKLVDQLPKLGFETETARGLRGLAEREWDEVGNLTGTFWDTASEKLGLTSGRQRLAHIGRLVFDAAYTRIPIIEPRESRGLGASQPVTSRPLVGERYGFDVGSFLQLTAPIAPTYQIEVRPELLSQRDLSETSLAQEVLGSLTGEEISQLMDSTKKLRAGYLEGFVAFHRDASEDNLSDANERLWRYLSGIDRELRIFPSVRRWISRERSTELRLRLWASASVVGTGTAIAAVCAGVWSGLEAVTTLFFGFARIQAEMRGIAKEQSELSRRFLRESPVAVRAVFR